MKIISLNVRGLGGLAKQKSLLNLFASLSLDLILLQETMNSTYPALLAFSKLRLGWEFCAISSSGLSGGILSAWNPLRVECKAFCTFAGILLTGKLIGFSEEINLLNIYGLYHSKELFWDKVESEGTFLFQI